MPNRSAFLLRALLLVSCALAAPRLLAQANISVPVKLWIEATGSSSSSMAASGDFLESAPGANDGEVDESLAWSSGDRTLDLGTVRMEPGKSYTVTFSSANLSNRFFHAAPPPGYFTDIDAYTTNRYPLTAFQILVVRVLPVGGSTPAKAGANTQSSSRKIDWRVSLGSLRNGESAGELALIDASLESNWSVLYTPAALHYESKSDEIFVHRSAGRIRQIVANEAVLDVVTLSGTSYEIRLYNPAQMQGSSYPRTFTGDPYLKYKIEPGTSPVSVKFTREAKNVTNGTSSFSVARRDIMLMERSGQWPGYHWTRTDWTLDGQAPLVEHAVSGAGSTVNDRVEALAIRVPGGHTALNATFDYTLKAWGEVLDSQTVGTTSSVTTDFEYHADSGLPGSYGYLKSIARTGGGWEAFDYHDADEATSKRAGTVKYAYQPYKSTPATVTMDPTQGVFTTFDYAADAFGYLKRPTLVETKIDNVLTAKSTITYTDNGSYNANNMAIVQAVREDRSDSNASNHLDTTTRYYREDVTDHFFRNQTHSVKQPDGVKIAFAYQRGTWNGTTFTLSANNGLAAGTASRIAVIRGAASSGSGGSLYATHAGYDVDDLYLIANKSTLDVSIRNSRALVARTEKHFWTGSAWQLVEYVNFTYNYVGQLTSRVASNGATTDIAYDGRLRTSETGESGIVHTFTYDAMGRTATATKAGIGAIGALATRFTYDALGNAVEEIVGDGQAEVMRTVRVYDDAGRPTAEQRPGLAATTFAYDPANRSRTTTFADGGTRIETSWLDGRLQKVEGTAVVPEYHDYGRESSDGRRWTQVRSGGQGGNPALADSSSTRWVKSWVDWLGRGVEQLIPAYNGGTATRTALFDTTTGLLTKTTQTGSAPTRYAYDPLGSLIRSGLDVNDNGLVLSSNDRITDTDTHLESYSSAWWLRTETKGYPVANDDDVITTSITRTRLTGHTSNRLSETQAIDAEGNVTTVVKDVNRTNRTLTTTTSRTGISAPATQVVLNGHVVSAEDHAGLDTSIAYDGLLRPYQATDSRSNITTTAYYPGAGLVFAVTNDAGHVVSTSFYDAMGRVTRQRDALGHYTRSAYNLRGQLTHQWGDAAYPVAYAYSATTGERTSMSTYRGGSGWEGDAWPSGTAGTADTTTWTFEAATGLLTAKTDAASRAVDYTYTAAGQLATREWARGLVTTYAYDSATAEQTGITYSDSTPDLSYTYTRLGQPATVTDVTGTRDWVYDPAKPWRLASEAPDPDFYGTRVFTPLYETSTMPGRIRGFKLGSTVGSNSELEQSFGYLGNGRFETILSGRSSNAVTRTFRYAYLANSDLLSALSIDGSHPFTVTRGYDADRDLVTSVETKWSTTSRTKYQFAYDARGLRSSVVQSGNVFADYYDGTHSAIFRLFTYNGRGEVTADVAYLGSDPADQSRPLHGRRHEFAYDSIGNRTSSNRTGVAALADVYTTNALNQYTTRENNTVPLSGTANTIANGVNVTVDGRTARAGRQSRYWNDETTVANTSGPWLGNVTVHTAKPGAGPGGTDLLRNETRSVLIPQDLQTFTYDHDGNLTGDGVWSYTWDAENRLIVMETPSGSIGAGLIPSASARRLEFKYDYLGRRVEKIVRSGWNGSIFATLSSQHRYLYDGWNLIAEYSVTATSPLTLSLVRSYTWGLDIVRSLASAGGVGALLQITDHGSGKSYLPAYDANGNVTALLNGDTGTSGALAASYEYGPFGELVRREIADATVAGQPFQFSTKFTDAETGLVYYGHRYYDPRNGRFLGRDPIGENGGVNLYGFVGNNAVNRWDYLGMAWVYEFDGWTLDEYGQMTEMFRYVWDGSVDDTEPKYDHGSIMGHQAGVLNASNTIIDNAMANGEFNLFASDPSVDIPAVAVDNPEGIKEGTVTLGQPVAIETIEPQPTTAIRKLAGVIDFFVKGAVTIAGTLALAGAGDMMATPMEREMVAIGVNDAIARAPNVATHLTGVPEGDFDRKMTEGTLELASLALGGAGLLRKAATTAGASAAKSGMQPRNALGQFMSRGPGQRPSGFNAVDDFVGQAQKNGYEVVGREVSFNTPFGQRRYDVVLRDPVTGRTSGIEIKSSAGAMNRGDAAARQQFAADRWINESGGATSVGGKGGITIESTYKIQW